MADIFLVGIKGVGMSALAQILKSAGNQVVGWDTPEEFFTDAILKKAGIPLFTEKKFKLKRLPDKAIFSQAYKPNHPVRLWLRKNGVPQIHYADAVAEIFNASFGVLVTGSHGKSTTSALAATLLNEAGFRPKALIGTEVLAWQSNALTGRGRYFVLEGDEYARVFLKYKPKLLLLTNIDWDHPDTYPTRRHYEAAFKKLIQGLDKEARIVACKEDKTLIRLLKKAPQKVYWYEAGDLNISLPTPLLGRHHRANAAGALKAAQLLGVPLSAGQKTLTRFKGTRRRLELRVKSKDRVLIDDYAHHPTEITATLKALKEYAPKLPLWVVFQPHTFSRTRVFLKDFAQSFESADKVIILEVYASAREKSGKIKGRDLARRLKGKAIFMPSFAAAAKFIQYNLPEKAVIVTMGAGDVWKLERHLLKLDHERPKK